MSGKIDQRDTTQRAYTARLELISDSRSARRNLARSHVLHNRLARTVQEFYLMLRAAAGPAEVERLVAEALAGEKEEVRAAALARARATAAMFWFVPEVGHPERFMYVVATQDLETALRAHLDGTGVDVDAWVDAAMIGLGAPLREGAVWVDRRRALGDLQRMLREIAGITLTDADAMEEIARECWVGSLDTDGTWVSALTANGEIKTPTNVSWATRILARGKALKDWGTLRERLPVVLDMPAVVEAVTLADLEKAFPGEGPLSQRIADAIGLTQESDLKSISKKLSGLAPATALRRFLNEKLGSARKSERPASADAIRDAMLWLRPELANDAIITVQMVNVAVSAAYRRVRQHTTSVRARYDERVEAISNAAEVEVNEAVLDVVVRWENATSTHMGDARFGDRQLRGITDVLKAWSKAKGADKDPRLLRAIARDVGARIDRSLDYVFIDLLASFHAEHRPSPKTLEAELKAIRDAREAERRLASLKAVACSMIDPARSPEYVKYGNSQWTVSLSTTGTSGLGQITMEVVGGAGRERVEALWRSQRIGREILAGNTLGDEPVSRLTRQGLAAAGTNHWAVRAPFKNTSAATWQWGTALTPARSALEALAPCVPLDPAAWTDARINQEFVPALERMDWSLTFSIPIERIGPGHKDLAARGLSARDGSIGGHWTADKRALRLARLGGLRVLAVDSGVRTPASVAVLETLSASSLVEICRAAGVPAPADTDVNVKVAGHTYCRLAAGDEIQDKAHPAVWARIEGFANISEEKPRKESRPQHLVEMHRIEKEIGVRSTVLERVAIAGKLDHKRMNLVVQHLGHPFVAPADARPLHSRDRIDHLSALIRSARSYHKLHQRIARALRYLLGNHNPAATHIGGFDLAIHDPRAVGLHAFHKEVASWQMQDSTDWSAAFDRMIGDREIPEPDDVVGWDRLVRSVGDKAIAGLAAECLALWRVRDERWNTQWLPRIRQLVLPSGRRIACGGSAPERIEVLRDLKSLSRGIRCTSSPDVPVKEAPPPGRLEKGLLRMIAAGTLNHRRTIASRIVGCALGSDPARKGPPCHWIVVEKLDMKTSRGAERRQNRFRATWGVHSLMTQLEQAADLHGVYMTDVIAAGTSQRHALTRRPVIRFHQRRPEWVIGRQRPRYVTQAVWDSILSSWDETTRTWTVNGNSWARTGSKWLPLQPGKKEPPPIRVPDTQGASVADVVTGAAFGADLNAAVNIGLRALQDPEWLEGILYVPATRGISWTPRFLSALDVYEDGALHRWEPFGAKEWMRYEEYRKLAADHANDWLRLQAAPANLLDTWAA
jgi:hypothetical protein